MAFKLVELQFSSALRFLNKKKSEDSLETTTLVIEILLNAIMCLLDQPSMAIDDNVRPIR